MDTKVTLLSHTQYPLETLYAVWIQSRTEGQVRTAAEYAEGRKFDEDLDRDVEKVFMEMLFTHIPALESISFTFMLEGVSIALREQIVRHRVGHRFNGQAGVDRIPNRVESSFWSQGMRIMDMGTFASAGNYLIPSPIKGNAEALRLYTVLMNTIQSVYKKLEKLGVPREDARNVIPLAAQHRMTWTLNLTALAEVLKKRGCWVAQLDLWEPIITGMVNELDRAIHPGFRRLIDPPCFHRGEWKGCIYANENEAMISGDDIHEPCPLYLFKDQGYSDKAVEGSIKNLDYFFKRLAQYEKLWGRDARTGEVKV